jgi:hypothetical protein
MKSIIKSFLLLCVISATFASCETYKDPKVDYSPVYPLSGEWRVRITDLSTNALVAQSMYTLGTYNTQNNDNNLMWIRTTSNVPLFSTASVKTLKAKVSCDVPSLSFNTNGVVQNLNVTTNAVIDTVVVTEGKVVLNSVSMPSGVKADRISFKITKTKAPGKTFFVEGYRRTRWNEDETVIDFK